MRSIMTSEALGPLDGGDLAADSFISSSLPVLTGESTFPPVFPELADLTAEELSVDLGALGFVGGMGAIAAIYCAMSRREKGRRNIFWRRFRF
jgi:hypothetical protein